MKGFLVGLPELSRQCDLVLTPRNRGIPCRPQSRRIAIQLRDDNHGVQSLPVLSLSSRLIGVQFAPVAGLHHEEALADAHVLTQRSTCIAQRGLRRRHDAGFADLQRERYRHPADLQRHNLDLGRLTHANRSRKQRQHGDAFMDDVGYPHPHSITLGNARARRFHRTVILSYKNTSFLRLDTGLNHGRAHPTLPKAPPLCVASSRSCSSPLA